jgi:hypothetical protein
MSLSEHLHTLPNAEREDGQALWGTAAAVPVVSVTIKHCGRHGGSHRPVPAARTRHVPP